MRAMKRGVYSLTYRKSLNGLARKVWHKHFFHKLKENCISAKLLNIVTDFLLQWNQRVALNRQYSIWIATEAGVPQVSIPGPLFFLIYINDLSGGLALNAKLFVDDTSLFSVEENMNKLADELNEPK